MDTLTRRIATALFAIIAVAVVARLAWELLRPVLPFVIVLLVVVAVLSLLIRRLRSW
jgi:hypothetical protein